MKFYSQQNEDKEIYNLFFKNKKIENGFFIELGAYDGIYASNTKFFEDELGFNGILIEPIQSVYEKLVKNRKNCITYNNVITTKENVIFIGNNLTAGVKETMSNSHLNNWGLSKLKGKKIKTNRIDNILKENNVKYVDVFSIDVEGGELEVLKTINWLVPIWIIIIELTPEKIDIDKLNDKVKKAYYERIDKDNECRKILLDNGFSFIKRIGGNDLWVNNNNKRTK
jgi:FkbM family methyltransferase